MSSKGGAWKRENLRIRFPSARSIEETGLDSARCREDISCFSPHFSHGRTVFAPDVATCNMSTTNGDVESRTTHTPEQQQRRKKLSNRSFRSTSFRYQEGRAENNQQHNPRFEKRFRGRRHQWKPVVEAAKRGLEHHYNINNEEDNEASSSCALKDVGIQVELADKDDGIQAEEDGIQGDLLDNERDLLTNENPFTLLSERASSDSEELKAEEAVQLQEAMENTPSSTLSFDETTPQSTVGESVQPDNTLARNRWRRLRHTVAFATHMASIKNAANDLLEEKRMEELNNEGAGGVGAAAFEGSKTGNQPRLKGRKGMEGLVVRQDKSLIGFVQDFYVACLKMPIGYFLIGVFLAPVALSLIFMPFFLLNIDGLTYDEAMAEQGLIGPLASAKEKCLALLNLFLYSLSLSTTFGGSPVIAVSPYCLLVANVNTLMAQFLFVFLSGAVFARMSQPSHPIRCSKKAIIRIDDFIPNLADGVTEKFRVLSIRLVLTGPPPCELVDAKICLTFRIFVTLPSGSMFCSTQDLEVVRPEVSYLRYGLMVRHIIDKKSPVYGHTQQSLLEGDASFSLTVMGLERASMQPIFHLEDYFVYDGDVVWDADYLDFIQANDKGVRVLDHSKIDLLKTFKAAGHVSTAVTRMKREAQKTEEKKEQEVEKSSSEKLNSPSSSLKSWVTSGIRNRKLWKCMSSSFTRADW